MSVANLKQNSKIFLPDLEGFFSLEGHAMALLPKKTLEF